MIHTSTTEDSSNLTAEKLQYAINEIRRAIASESPKYEIWVSAFLSNSDEIIEFDLHQHAMQTMRPDTDFVWLMHSDVWPEFRTTLDVNFPISMLCVTAWQGGKCIWPEAPNENL